MKHLVLALIWTLLAACSHKSEDSGVAARMVSVAETAEQKPQGKYIAHTYELSYEAPEEVLMQRFQAIEAECVRLGCQILKASRANRSAGMPPSAVLSARIPPASLPAFLNSTAAANTLTHQTRSSEDKTVAVIDAEAKIKNLTALKARILQLLEQRAGNLADILAAEKQLGEIQTELDIITSVRKVLALETEMVKVDIRLETQSSVSQTSGLYPIAQALDSAGEYLANSVAALIVFAVSVLPWLIVLVPAGWWIRRLLRRRRERIAAAARTA